MEGQLEMQKTHRMVDGKWLQMNKQFSSLKERQKTKIAEWVYTAYREAYQKGGQIPGKGTEREILDSVMEKIEEADIWIPYGEIAAYYRKRRNKLKKRLERELTETEE